MEYIDYRLLSVKPIENMNLLLVFQNGVEKTFDVRQMYSEYPPFKVLETDLTLFNQVRLCGDDGVIWNDDLDLDAYGLWHYGVATGVIHEVDDITMLGYNLTKARNACDMYQNDLAKKCGIAQGDISDIERGKANPTFKTLKRLADAMNMRLKIEFVPKE